MVKYVNPDNPAAGVLIETRSDPHTGITVTVSPGDDGEFHKPQAAPDQAEQGKAAVAPMLTPQDIENAEIQQMQSDLDQARAAIVGTTQRVEGKQFDQQRRVAQSDAASDTPSSFLGTTDPGVLGDTFVAHRRPVETAKDTSGKKTTDQRGGEAVEKSTLDEPPARTVSRGMLTVNDLGPLPGEPVSPVFGDQDRENDEVVVFDKSGEPVRGNGTTRPSDPKPIEILGQGDDEASTTTTTAAPEDEPSDDGDGKAKRTKKGGGGSR